MLSNTSPPRYSHADGPADTAPAAGGEHDRAFSLERILVHGHALRLYDGDLVPPAVACRVEAGRIGVGLGGTEPRLVHLLGPGAWFRVEASPRRLVHRAVGAARVVLVERNALQAARPNDAAVVELAMLESERDRILALTAALLVDDPLQRLAMRLAALYADVGADHLDLTQADLAAMAALSRHTVNRALARLEADGIIVNRYRRIEVNDLEALRAVADRKPERRRQDRGD
jgi:CRP-like cAMP-binding protein